MKTYCLNVFTRVLLLSWLLGGVACQEESLDPSSATLTEATDVAPPAVSATEIRTALTDLMQRTASEQTIGRRTGGNSFQYDASIVVSESDTTGQPGTVLNQFDGELTLRLASDFSALTSDLRFYVGEFTGTDADGTSVRKGATAVVASDGTEALMIGDPAEAGSVFTNDFLLGSDFDGTSEITDEGQSVSSNITATFTGFGQPGFVYYDLDLAIGDDGSDITVERQFRGVLKLQPDAPGVPFDPDDFATRTEPYSGTYTFTERGVVRSRKANLSIFRGERQVEMFLEIEDILNIKVSTRSDQTFTNINTVDFVLGANFTAEEREIDPNPLVSSRILVEYEGTFLGFEAPEGFVEPDTAQSRPVSYDLTVDTEEAADGRFGQLNGTLTLFPEFDEEGGALTLERYAGAYRYTDSDSIDGSAQVRVRATDAPSGTTLRLFDVVDFPAADVIDLEVETSEEVTIGESFSVTGTRVLTQDSVTSTQPVVIGGTFTGFEEPEVVELN